MILNDAGEMLWTQIEALPQRFPQVELDELIVMPNQVHGIFVINATSAGTSLVAAPLGDIVGAWKSITTDEYIRGVRQKNWAVFDRRLWQRNYWEHIIRNESDLNRTRNYIINNPSNWKIDDHHPNAKP